MNTIAATHTIGEPQLAGPLAVFPVFGPPPRLSYRTFAGAAELGALVRELDGAASVRDLLVENPTDLPLLLYEGEEVLGAQQNRTFDEPVLVDAGAKARVPVSCVEAGRWDGSRSREAMRPSPQAADPGLRRLKRAGVAAAGRASQQEVWDAVDARLGDGGVESPSAAMSDVYDRRRHDLGSLTRAVRPREGQVGAVAAVSGMPVVLDLVSSPEAFASLLPRLALGYALDALGGPEVRPDAGAAAAMLAQSLAAPRLPLPTPGMGQGIAIGVSALLGSGLEHDGELVALSAFPMAAPGRPCEPAASVRIRRPSGRRPG